MNDVDKIVNEIAVDFKSGATALASRGLDALEILAKSLSQDPNAAKKDLTDLVQRLEEVRPSMGAIGMQAISAFIRAHNLVAQGVPWANAMSDAVQKERETLRRADQIIATLVKQEIGSGGIIVSCSESTTVKSAFVELKPDLVRIGEGHRMGDGVSMAKWLANNGVDVEVVPDGALPTAVDGARAILIGADQVLADGSVVNRCSSFCLALAARYFNIPFIVACQKIKLSGQTQVAIEESPDFLCGLPDKVVARAPIFDITPADLVHKIITESGAMKPTEAGEQGRAIALKFK